MGTNEHDLDDHISVWVGNLGKYNRSELLGKWVTLPTTTEELDGVLENDLGLTLDPNEAFERGMRGEDVYEEYFIADYEYTGLLKEIGYKPPEYSDIHAINALAAVTSAMSSPERECLSVYLNDNTLTDPGDVTRLAYAIREGDMGGYFAYDLPASAYRSPDDPQSAAYHDNYWNDPMNRYVETIYTEDRVNAIEEALRAIGEDSVADNIYPALRSACEDDVNGGLVDLRENGYVEACVNPPDWERYDIEDAEADFLPAHAGGHEQSPAIEDPTVADRQAAISQAGAMPRNPRPSHAKGR